ncbi:MAG: decaprenyl-phosphate phosphoribosyltransferase [Solirubrobacterales bacterium]|nr:decaprenyl-phosphate phosphoribosyltransferase [Solirubrobacterales bacterium]MBV9166780.1 decaprenyl-phosphate phosphoribosyltransferase [Solirubrobacterales bacterium]MBV9534992.1 decaprenyl-phosphate phosphoribosyltransferase [Solirubrobacterales bacterium]
MRREPVPVTVEGSAAEVPQDTGEIVQLPVAARRQRGRLLAAVVTMRPRQWLKNLLVVAAAVAAGALGHDDVPVRVTLAFVAFCMLASGLYAINDVRDAAEDRLHERKRYRPVAARELSASSALALGVTLVCAGLALCTLVRPLLGVVGGGYVLLTLSYTLVWRHVLILDLMAIAGGFVLRAVAGGVAPPVPLSRWFLLVISAAAVCVAAGKRYAELRRAQAQSSARRRVLHSYSLPLLRRLLVASGLLALFAYSMWAFQLPLVVGVPWRPLTILPFALCLIRYGALVRAGAGEAPDELILQDRLLQVAALAWLLLFALGVHAAG